MSFKKNKTPNKNVNIPTIITRDKNYNISSINSNTAKNGYKEEDLVANDLNFNETIRSAFMNFIKFDPQSIFKKLKGNYKTDITDGNGCNLQIKKYKKNQFGQIDRHWITDIISYIPNLEPVKYMLIGLCEIPLKPCGKFIDKNQKRKLLSIENYTEEELKNLLKILNDTKRQFLEYIFYGKDKTYSPTYICGVKYKNNIRKKITIYNISDIITDLEKHSFIITKRKSVISLGNCITLQRKGGDGGKKSSNQLQTKLVFSKIQVQNFVKFKL